MSQTGRGLLLCFQVHHLGFFDNEEEAARVYDAAVLKLRGPSCHTNFDPRQAAGREPLKDSLVESMTNSSLPRSVIFLPAAQTSNGLESCPKRLYTADLCDVSSTVSAGMILEAGGVVYTVHESSLRSREHMNAAQQIADTRSNVGLKFCN